MNLTSDNLKKRQRTKELSAVLPFEAALQPHETYQTYDGTVVEITPASITVTKAGQRMRVQTSGQNVLSFNTKAPLGALQFHISGDPRTAPQSNIGSRAASHNSALFATLFGLVIASSATVFCGYNTLLSDFRLPFYRATIGARRAPLGKSWFNDKDILAIYDEVINSKEPLLVSLNASKKTTKDALALSAIKTIWPPMVRPTVTTGSDGELDVHPEFRALGTPHTFHDATAICYFLAGIWKALPDYVLENHSADFGSHHMLESCYSYNNFLKSIWEVTVSGMNARVFWFDGEYHIAKDLVCDIILPLAEKGLLNLGVSMETCQLYLGGIRRNTERNITPGSVELLPYQFGITDPVKVRKILKEIHQKVTQMSMNSFLYNRYATPLFVSDILSDEDRLCQLASDIGVDLSI